MQTDNALFCRSQAEADRSAAEDTQLVNVRERCLRSAERWEAMAARAERGAELRRAYLQDRVLAPAV